MRGYRLVGFSCLLALLAGAAVAEGSTLLSQLTDPAHPGVSASLDILSARIDQGGGRLTFTMTMRGAIPTSLPQPDDTQTYLWFVDTDENPSTGQSHGAIGSEFNVRAVVGQTYGGGWVDVTGSEPGGGDGVVTIDGSTITIAVWLPQLNAPADFNWSCSTFAIYSGIYTPGNDDTGTAHAVTLPYTPPAHVTVTTPILELCPSGPATGQLQVVLRDAGGNILPNVEHVITYHSTNDAVATVDANGLVTAIAPPEFHWQTPYIEVWGDGLMTDNSAVIRVNSLNVGVTHQTYAAAHVSFYLPPVVEGVDLAQITSQFEVVPATEMAYMAQKLGLGTAAPTNGGTAWFVLDVADNPVTSVCGASGNPIRLGWTWGVPENNSCYITNVPCCRQPQWFVMWHEMGHNFTCACNAFNMFLWSPSETHNFAYSEGLASLAAMWSWRILIDQPLMLGFTSRANIDDAFCNQNDEFLAAVAAYKSGGANYETLTPDILDGILVEMKDRYYVKPWYDLFSTFLPAPDPIPIAIDSKEKQATWFVAAMSASAGQDLRSLFASEYGFPIDEEAWPDIMDAVQARVDARHWGETAVGESVPALARSQLLPNVPNPFNPRTEIRFVLAGKGPAKVSIHDVRGRLVRELPCGVLEPGEHAVVWDGRDKASRRAASGTYFARLVTPTGADERKLTLVK